MDSRTGDRAVPPLTPKSRFYTVLLAVFWVLRKATWVCLGSRHGYGGEQRTGQPREKASMVLQWDNVKGKHTSS